MFILKWSRECLYYSNQGSVNITVIKWSVYITVIKGVFYITVIKGVYILQ